MRIWRWYHGHKELIGLWKRWFDGCLSVIPYMQRLPPLKPQSDNLESSWDVLSSLWLCIQFAAEVDSLAFICSSDWSTAASMVILVDKFPNIITYSQHWTFAISRNLHTIIVTVCTVDMLSILDDIHMYSTNRDLGHEEVDKVPIGHQEGKCKSKPLSDTS